MRIEQMTGRTGRPVANQFIIHDDHGGMTFQSYQTVIARRDQDGSVTLDPQWAYSATTSKYRAAFLGESTKETAAKIAIGEYTVCNLNG